MSFTLRITLLTAILCGPSFCWPDSALKQVRFSQNTSMAHNQVYYSDVSAFPISIHAIVLQGTQKQIARLTHWLDEIRKVPHGKKMIDDILLSGHQLLIRHSEWALQSSGRTLAPITDNLTNGKGEDVEIMFDTRIPEEGSHWVFDSHNQPIQFTAVENLFHELAHARHLTNGTWRYYNSEAQAIEEENIFRTQLAHKMGQKKVSLRMGKDGIQFWRPSH